MSNKFEMPNPTEADMASQEFEAIWHLIKSWDVSVPSHYSGYCGANGSHVKMILDALRAAHVVERKPVAYLDIGAGGYMDLGSDLSDEELSRLPCGRHILAIAGTYGIDGYTSPAAPVVDRQPTGQWRISVNGDWFYGTKEQCERERAEYETTFTAEDYAEAGVVAPEQIWSSPPAPVADDLVRLLTRARIYARGEFRDEIDACLAGKTAPVAAVLPRYTCIGKGGEYELLGSAIGAGTLKEMSAIPVYRDTTTGQIFVRTPLDFSTRMESIDKVKELNQ